MYFITDIYYNNKSMLDINSFNNIISKNIKKIIRNEINQYNSVSIDNEYFSKFITNNSKKIRAYLVYIGYTLAGNFELNNDILNIASAIEIFHSSLLIHDDVIDNSFFRRGDKTFHKHYADILSSEEKGISYAIMSGDLGLFLSIRLISNINSEFKSSIISLFSDTALKTMFGEIFDFFSSIDNIDDISYKDILEICNYKTAFYTIDMPLKLGIYFSGEIKNINLFNEYAYNLGLVYQISDDLNEIFLPFSETGKDPFNDIKEGKINSVTKLTLEKTVGEDKKYFESILRGNNKLDELKVRDIIKKSGAYDLLLKDIDNYSKKASELILSIKIPDNSKKYLLSLIESIQYR
jgi:geranylgeranyl diphosphate synthase type I